MQPQQTLERETFADAQERHRRAERAAFGTCLAAAVVVGLPLAVVVSPLVVAVVVLATDVLSLALPVPDLGGLAAHHLLGLGGSPVEGWPGVVRWAWGVTGTLLLLAPAAGLMVATWLGVRRLVRRSGADALVLATGARPPRRGDPTEQRLVNLVDEMAIAAGVPSLQVMVLDEDNNGSDGGGAGRAVVAGRSVEDATIVIPRGLLDALGRDATGAVVAQLLAMARAGDLGLAVTVASVLQAFDLVGAVLAAPTNRRTRRALWRFARLAARPDRTGAAGRAQVDEEARFLSGELAALARGEASPEPARGLVMGLVQLPFLVASLAFTLMRLGPGALLVDPALATLWRRRRLAADATAVELTRDPGALARALAYLESQPGPVGPWALPAATPDTAVFSRDWMRRPSPLARLRLGAARWATRRAAHREAGAPLVTAAGAGAGPAAETALVTFVPPLAERLDRVHAMGPGLAAGGRRDTTRQALTWAARVAGAAAAVLAAGALVYVTLVVAALVLAPPTALLHAALR